MSIEQKVEILKKLDRLEDISKKLDNYNERMTTLEEKNYQSRK